MSKNIWLDPILDAIMSEKETPKKQRHKRHRHQEYLVMCSPYQAKRMIKKLYYENKNRKEWIYEQENRLQDFIQTT